MPRNSALYDKLREVPEACGVYLFKDRRQKVIYVGKAVNLRSRVRSYFQATGDQRPLVEHLRPRIADLDWVVVATEKEALILENNLIKQFKPRFNINLKDDKTFLSIRLDRRRPFPRLELVRRYKEDGARYFGPYSSAASVRETLRVVNAVFPIRKCPDGVFRNRTRPCLYHELGRCLAPCVGLCDEATYAELLDEVELFLRGRNQELAERLRRLMQEASERREYELAARFRDQLAAVEKTIERQVVAGSQSTDRDVFGFYKEGETMQVQALLVRRGKLEDVPTYTLDTRGLDARAAFEEFLKQFYGRSRFIPKEVVVPVELADAAPIAEWLSERRGSKVSIVVPKRGDKARLVEMATRNAESSYRAAHASEDHRRRVLEGLKAALGLEKLPVAIECFDVSNIAGREAVAAMVRFENAVPRKSRYRRYKIKTVEGCDDYAMMREALERRLRRGLEEGDLPDLIVVDGGKGQLAVATQVAADLGVEGVELAALAKGRSRRRHLAPDATPEQVFVPGRSAPITLPSDSPELYLLDRLRDEAHRFAITYHRKLRRQPYRGSVLDRVPGVGPARKKALIARFGSVRAVRQATVEELAGVPGISRKQAETIHAFFHGPLRAKSSL